MKLVEGIIQIEPNYFLKVAQGNHIVLIMGATVGSPAALFRHPNVVAKIPRVMEFKHYRKTGSKFWTDSAGIDFYFVLPKSSIELVMEKGYSYVPVIINGRKITLNVSGGGSTEWTDFIGNSCHTFVTRSKLNLKKLAEVALSPDECKIAGITFDITREEPHQLERFKALSAALIVRESLKPGSRIMLGGGYSYGECKGPFELIEKYNKHYICHYGYNFRVYYRHVDWVKTAELNNISIPDAETFNLIGFIKDREAA